MNDESNARPPFRNPYDKTQRTAFGRQIREEGPKSAYGRPIEEAATTPWGRPTGVPASTPAPTVVDFRDVGLNDADAKAAALGLSEGKYLSFEDACLSRAIFGESKQVTLDEDRMRAKAKQFTTVRGT